MIAHGPQARALVQWAGVLAVLGAIAGGAAACGGGSVSSVPPLPTELEQYRNEPVQELTCAACHGPSGRAEEVVLDASDDRGDLPEGHRPTEGIPGSPQVSP